MLVVVVMPGTEAIAPRTQRRAPLAGRRTACTMQPSEFAKIALIIWTAALAVKKQDKLPSLSRGLLPFLVVWGLVVVLIFLRADPCPPRAIVLLLAALVVFAGGARIGHFILLGVVGTAAAAGRRSSGRVPHAAASPRSWIRSHDPAGVSYQINQALIAIGSGGVFGRGFGHGLQKFGFLPEPHNDFLLAMIGEEWGFLGVLALIALFAAFALIGYRIARQAPDLFGFLLAVGLTNLIVVQALLHMAVNMALDPDDGCHAAVHVVRPLEPAGLPGCGRHPAEHRARARRAGRNERACCSPAAARAGTCIPRSRWRPRCRSERPGTEVHFVGAQRGVEARVLPAEKQPHTLLPFEPLRRSRVWENWRLLPSLVQQRAGAVAAVPHVQAGAGRRHRRLRERARVRVRDCCTACRSRCRSRTRVPVSRRA